MAIILDLKKSSVVQLGEAKGADGTWWCGNLDLDNNLFELDGGKPESWR